MEGRRNDKGRVNRIKTGRRESSGQKDAHGSVEGREEEVRESPRGKGMGLVSPPPLAGLKVKRARVFPCHSHSERER